MPELTLIKLPPIDIVDVVIINYGQLRLTPPPSTPRHEESHAAWDRDPLKCLLPVQCTPFTLDSALEPSTKLKGSAPTSVSPVRHAYLFTYTHGCELHAMPGAAEAPCQSFKKSEAIGRLVRRAEGTGEAPVLEAE